MTSKAHDVPDPTLADSITRAASSQTYYTVRFLVDRNLVPEAYRAYAYFRWVDDQLDQDGMEKSEKAIFVSRQKKLADQCYQGMWPRNLCDEEEMLVALIRSDKKQAKGLQVYIRNMMAVMNFDAERKGRLITQDELGNYTRWLAIAVTEALHYFIGHGCASPHSDARYLAVTAAHITHMLRDTVEDIEAGYFNIPREFLQAHHIGPQDIESDAYQAWVRSRVQAARACFDSGKEYLAQVENFRFRLAAYTYCARFEGLLDAIEQDGYRLRPTYPEYKTYGAALRASWSALSLAIHPDRPRALSHV